MLMKSQDVNLSSEEDITNCPAIAYQKATVCAGVECAPYATSGTPTTYCCGDPIVSTDKSGCAGTKNGKCTFTISQDICMKIPVEFGASVTVGDPYVKCGEPSNSPEICDGCNLSSLSKTYASCGKK